MNNASVVIILSSLTLQIKENSCVIVCEFWIGRKKKETPGSDDNDDDDKIL
jgi:hypothetical protein